MKDITWLRSDGREMTDEEWQAGYLRALGIRLAGDAIVDFDERGQQVTDDTLLILLNAHAEMVPFVLPPGDGDPRAGRWKVLVDTQLQPDVKATLRQEHRIMSVADEYLLAGRSLAVLCYVP